MDKPKYDGIKVFSATMHKDRDVLGERVNEWLRANPKFEVVDTVVTQSSDQAYHCVSITIFYATAKQPVAMPVPR